MKGKLKKEHLQTLERLIGEEVIISSHYEQQDEHGVASHGSYCHKGLLKKVDYQKDPTITITTDYVDELTLAITTQDTNHIWNQHTSIYHNGARAYTSADQMDY